MDLEIELLLEGIFRRYGFDFRHYAPASLGRRIEKVLAAENLATPIALLDRLLREPAAMERFLLGVSIGTTALFRDPEFFSVLRHTIVPQLRSYPLVRAWVVGCANGEEAYSLAILLREVDLFRRCRIYATDMNAALLEQAKEGILPIESMQQYTLNYLKAGGTGEFSRYYTALYDRAILDPTLRENIVFAQHNLVTDRSFNEFQLILCRNVLIYFDRILQDQVHELLYGSLCPLGFLGLGLKETIRFSPYESAYSEVDAACKWYQRMS
jgi:chemotaxis protein methyltransferase CheR